MRDPMRIAELLDRQNFRLVFTLVFVDRSVLHDDGSHEEDRYPNFYCEVVSNQEVSSVRDFDNYTMNFRMSDMFACGQGSTMEAAVLDAHEMLRTSESPEAVALWNAIELNYDIHEVKQEAKGRRL